MIELAGRRLEHELPGRQGRLLFAYLAANRLRPTSRGELVEALWPSDPPRTAEGSVNALLSKLRRALGAETLVGRSTIRLQLPADAWIDLEAAAEALHRAEAAVAQQDWKAAWGPARVTQHIAQRGFLPGEDAPWIAEVRGRLEELHRRALECVAQASLVLGGVELDTAERAARALVQVAPYRESGYRYLMLVHERRGNRAEALQLYDELRTFLREKLGASPSDETQALHRRLLS